MYRARGTPMGKTRPGLLRTPSSVSRPMMRPRSTSTMSAPYPPPAPRLNPPQGRGASSSHSFARPYQPRQVFTPSQLHRPRAANVVAAASYDVLAGVRGQNQRGNHASVMANQFKMLRTQQSQPLTSGDFSRGTSATPGPSYHTGHTMGITWEEDFTLDDEFGFDDLQTTSEPKSLVPVAAKPIAVKKEVKDTGMRMLTVTPSILKRKNYRTQADHLMFEIFGTMSSGTSRGIQSAVHFCLKSDNDVIPCVFYEIDRKIGNLLRDQLYRCVGSYDDRGNMKCVSVRAASMSEKTYLNRLTHLTREP